MVALRTGVSIILMLVAMSLVIMNWASFIKSKRNPREGSGRYHSTVPFLSLVLAGIAFGVYPFNPKAWIWVIPVADLGNWWALVGLAHAIAYGVFRKTNRNSEESAKNR